MSSSARHAATARCSESGKRPSSQTRARADGESTRRSCALSDADGSPLSLNSSSAADDVPDDHCSLSSDNEPELGASLANTGGRSPYRCT